MTAMTRTIPFPPAPEPGWYEDDLTAGPAAPPVHALVDDIESVADEPFDPEALAGDGIGPGPRTPSPIDDIEDPDDAYPATSAAIPLRTVPMTLRGDASAPSFLPPSYATPPTGDGLPGDARSTLPRHREPVSTDGTDTPGVVGASGMGGAHGAAAVNGMNGSDAEYVKHADHSAAPAAASSVGTAASSANPVSASVAPAPRRSYLLRNDSTGQSIVVDASMLLGRRPSNPVPEGAKIVQLDDPTRTISRNHATITMDEDGRLWLDDCESLNGTYLVVEGHDHRVAPGQAVPVDAPAVVRFGDQLFDLTENTGN